MHLYLETNDLNTGILSVIKALPVRSSMAILDGIHMEAKEGSLTLKCSDLMLQKECIVPAEIEKEGTSIVPGKLFSEILRKMPSGRIEIRADGKTLNIQSEKVKSSVQCIEYEAFPEMRFSGDTYPVEVKAKELSDMILKTVFATSQDEAKPILTGALMEISDTLRFVATDSYQFALRQKKLDRAYAQREMIIPGKSLIEIARMMEEGEEENAELLFTSTHVKVKREGVTLTARLLEGDYIKYRQIIPSSCKTRVTLDRSSLMEGIDRAQLMAREGNSNVIMSFQNDLLTISSKNASGDFQEEVPCTVVGDDLRIAFNPRYCMNILKNIDDEKICMEFITNISPAVIRPLEGEDYYYLIVPVRIYAQY